MFLVVHRDNRQIPRIRVALTHITEWVHRQASELLPRADPHSR
jgi:hypothetical protein